MDENRFLNARVRTMHVGPPKFATGKLERFRSIDSASRRCYCSCRRQTFPAGIFQPLGFFPPLYSRDSSIAWISSTRVLITRVAGTNPCSISPNCTSCCRSGFPDENVRFSRMILILCFRGCGLNLLFER